mmetsp:Transcript_542/g.808  ORF Transcript_542/g.808 Transcript_542/m.808 type:complete len:208 (-) Transcript_542:898-1521(-)
MLLMLEKALRLGIAGFDSCSPPEFFILSIDCLSSLINFEIVRLFTFCMYNTCSLPFDNLLKPASCIIFSPPRTFSMNFLKTILLVGIVRFLFSSGRCRTLSNIFTIAFTAGFTTNFSLFASRNEIAFWGLSSRIAFRNRAANLRFLLSFRVLEIIFATSPPLLAEQAVGGARITSTLTGRTLMILLRPWICTGTRLLLSFRSARTTP